jgi:transposase-like protein
VTSLAMGWPAPLRMFLRVLVGSASTAAFAILMIIAREVMLAFDLAEPQLSARGRRQAGAGLADDPAAHQVIRNEFIVRLVSLSAWLVAALSILGQLQADHRHARFGVGIELGGLRLTPLLLIKLGVLLAVALWLSNIASNFSKAGSSSRRPDAVDPGAADQMVRLAC